MDFGGGAGFRLPVRVWVLGVEGFSVSEGKVSGILGGFRAFGSLV